MSDRLVEVNYGYLDEKGEYHGQWEGCRKTCKDCKFSSHENGLGESRKKCNKLNMAVSKYNNICRQFQPFIVNPSHRHEFNCGAYFEWLMNDYYRPYKSSGEIIGSGRLGEAIPDNGRLADLFPNIYSHWYGVVDCLRCKLHIPRCHVYIGKHGFDINYRKFADGIFLDTEGNIYYDRWYYKEKVTSRKYTSHINGSININKLEEL